MSDYPIKEIKVIGVEKPQKGKFQEHYVRCVNISLCQLYDIVSSYVAIIFQRLEGSAIITLKWQIRMPLFLSIARCLSGVYIIFVVIPQYT